MHQRWLIYIVAGWIFLPATFLWAQTPPPAEIQVVEITFGSSTEGRPITGTQIGTGPRKLYVIANTHGGPEANTYRLALALQEYFRGHPDEVPAAVSLIIIPTLNPDGLTYGTRFNSRGVDLNRNMNTNFDSCPENDWQQTVQGAYGYVSDTGGPGIESEVEAQLVRRLVLDAAAVVWVHSSGGNVFPALCEHAESIALAQAYAAASGYTYERYWSQYLITGGMHDWAGALGIASITPELATGDQPEIEQNLAALQAILSDYERLLPELPPTVEPQTGIEMPAIAWRYWQAHGGAAIFGLPLSPLVTIDGQQIMFFAQHRLVFNEASEERPLMVEADGQAQWTEYLLQAPTSAYQLR